MVVVTIDPARRLADALGMPGGLSSEPTPIDHEVLGLDRTTGSGGELWAMMLDAPAAFVDVVRRNAADEAQAERIITNPFFRNVAATLGGTQDYMAAETLYLLHRDERFDLVVVDTPPTRNALDFLDAPGVLVRFLDHRLFRLLMLPAQRGMKVVGLATQPILRAIGRVVGTDVLADVVAFFQAFSGMEGGFRERADAVTTLLRSAGTRYVIVTSPWAEAVTEAAWFADQLGHQGIDAVAGVVNRIQPAFGDGTADDAATAATEAADPGAAALWSNLAELRRRREAELEQLAAFTRHFGDAPLAEVPLLPGDVHDLEGLAHIGRHLFGT